MSSHRFFILNETSIIFYIGCSISCHLDTRQTEKLHELEKQSLGHCCCCLVAKSNSLEPMDYSTPISSVAHYLPELLQFTFIELVMLSNHLIFCHPVLLLLSIFPSIKVFCKRSFSPLHIRWPKYWSFSFSVSPPNEYSGFISSRIEWFDLLAVQRTLKSLLQHNSSKTSIL